MNPVANKEQEAAEAFSRQSVIFDKIYSPNLTIQYKRMRVRSHVEAFLKPHSRILELNAGTGEDAIYFAQQGHRVHATDISEGMQAQLKAKVQAMGLEDSISTELCSFNNLDMLQARGPYDLVFSNFAGLNCTDQLGKVLLSLDSLLKPDGAMTLVILPPFCLWETTLALRGQFKTAFRRLFSRHGRQAHIEGQYFMCWYYKPSYIINTLKIKYELIGVEGLCTIVPPSFYEGFPLKRPRLYRWLQKWEARLKSTWPWKNIGDYYIISLKKKEGL